MKQFYGIQEVFPEGMEIFLGVTMVKQDGEFKQKSGFIKVQGMSKSKKVAKKPTATQKKTFEENKKIVDSFKELELEEGGF